MGNFLKRARGRPRKLALKAQIFLDQYLDPYLAPADICQRLRISLATFYRYEEELALPQIKVGLGTVSGLGSKTALRRLQDPVEFCDLTVIRSLAPLLGVRLNLYADDPMVILEKVKTGEMDMAIGSLCVTPERKRVVAFSHPYIASVKPHGQVFTRRKATRVEKPKLGVIKGTVHQQYAERHLRGGNQVTTFANFAALFAAVDAGSLDSYFVYTKYAKSMSSLYQPEGPVRRLPGETAMAIRSGDEDLCRLVNAALEQLHSRGVLQSIENRYFGDSSQS